MDSSPRARMEPDIARFHPLLRTERSWTREISSRSSERHDAGTLVAEFMRLLRRVRTVLKV